MSELVGRVVDRHNTVWMMRYRYNYSISPAKALYLAIDHGYMLRRRQLAELVESATLEEFIYGLPESIKEVLGDASDIVSVEYRMQLDLIRRARQAVSHSPSIVAAVFGYLILRFYELKSLYAIILARYSGIDDTLLQSALYYSQLEVA
jgi:V/A-type H+-transporting ATPase subunit C